MLKYVDPIAIGFKKMIKFGISKKILRRGKVEKTFNLSLSKENK